MPDNTYTVVYTVEVDRQIVVTATNEEEARKIADEFLDVNPVLDEFGDYDRVEGVESFGTYEGKPTVTIYKED